MILIGNYWWDLIQSDYFIAKWYFWCICCLHVLMVPVLENGLNNSCNAQMLFEEIEKQNLAIAIGQGKTMKK